MEGYQKQYEEKKAVAKTMLYDGMRKRQSLDGLDRKSVV